MRREDLLVFAGPSLSATEARSRVRCRVMPPARQGDVWRALSLRPMAIALIDGVFESQPSVWHRELLTALDAGIAVFGAASMGALRAVELESFGMVGVGQVFRWFRDGVIDDDSEVALLQAPAGMDFRAITVPLVNVRHAARLARTAKVLSSSQARVLVEMAASIFYQDRTWSRVIDATAPRWPTRALERWRLWSADGLEDLKHRDAVECLDAAAEYVKATRAWHRHSLPPREADVPSSMARRRRLGQGMTRPSAQIAVDGVAILRALKRRPDAAELTARGLRRALLAGWAREFGLRPPALSATRAQPGLDAATQTALLEESALEAQMLRNADRVLTDGPSPEEALASECQLNGLWLETARRLAKTQGAVTK